MKLGTQTGSLQNHILSRAVIGQPDPEVGMGATILCWTDRHAATITSTFRWRGRLMIDVQQDTARIVSGTSYDDTAVYSYERNPNGRKTTYRQAKTGQWEEVSLNPATNRYSKTGGNGLRIGERGEYRDPSF